MVVKIANLVYSYKYIFEHLRTVIAWEKEQSYAYMYIFDVGIR